MMTDKARLPIRFDTIEALEDFMSTPSAALIEELSALPGDILVLGVGGKMGPTLARLAKRAAPEKRRSLRTRVRTRPRAGARRSRR